MVNEFPASFFMKLGTSGEAFFVQQSEVFLLLILRAVSS